MHDNMEEAGDDAEDPILNLDLDWLVPNTFDWRQAANPAFVTRMVRHLENRARTLQEDTLHPFIFLTERVKALAQDPGSSVIPWGTVDSARDAPNNIYILGHNHWNAESHIDLRV